MRTLHPTGASAYREMPQAVALPKNETDICKPVRFARKHRTSLIPRTAGTSLAGQLARDSEAAPCPFCKKAKGEIRRSRGGFIGVCPNCDARGPKRESHGEVLMAWNGKVFSKPGEYRPHLDRGDLIRPNPGQLKWYLRCARVTTKDHSLPSGTAFCQRRRSD
jgi:hypothetical protein